MPQTIKLPNRRIPQKKGDPIPQVHLWYLHEKFDYKKYAKLKGKVIGYFKSESRKLRHGLREMKLYYKLHESGLVVYVDAEMMKIGVRQNIDTKGLMGSDKKEFEKQFNAIINLIK